MADVEQPQDAEPKKKSKKPLIIGLVLFLALGGGGFYAVYSGMILGHEDPAAAAAHEVEPLPEIAFVPVETLMISLGKPDAPKFLRFTSQLETDKAYAEEVAMLMPRIVDVMNGYLRAVEVEELVDPASMVRVRAQMLRRIQIVTGEGRVRDLLITEFVLN